MSDTNNMNPKHLMLLALLGIGAYLLTTKRANAATSSTAGQAWRQSPTRAISPLQPAGNQGVVAAGVNLFSQLFSGGTAALYRTPDFVPTYTPDTVGEVAAQDVYRSNPDAFASNPPNYGEINSTPWAQSAINDPSDY